MTRDSVVRLGVFALGVTLTAAACAKAPADQVARLGKDLTPVGAEVAANKDGSIPAWTGGLTKAPAGFNPAKGYVDPFAAEKPLYTITQNNVDEYKDRLAPGQQALLKRYPNYKLVVYPSHRSAASPSAVYEAVRAEAGQIELGPGGNGILNLQRSTVPFPVPQNGLEVIWNTAFRYRGNSVERSVVEFPVQVNGTFTPVRRNEQILFRSGLAASPDNQLFFYLTTFVAPSSVAGEATLLHEFVDQVKQPRAAWVYNPGSRRVLRAPEVAFDTPRTGTDGLGTMDDYDGYTGSPERYNWKLLGKREMIISYNNYKLSDKSLKYSQIVKPQVLNQDLVRYELHRVWVVEATLKPGKNHLYAKRVYFLDEDTWQIVHADAYDGRGDLWRVFEQYSMQYYDVPAHWGVGAASYDLQARRYVASALSNEEPPYVFNTPMSPADFSTSALRRKGD